ncbi:hypothetical protein HDU76_002937 [Blyttiomyces sp. JEL0837]|nr:hypothetical protein HDU76_002937 [Blyttiomyces sp. JEL0837]
MHLKYGHYEIVKLLLGVQGVDATACNNEAIRCASRCGQSEIVEKLLKVQGVDTSADNYQAIFGALANGHEMVLGCGANTGGGQGVDPCAKNNVALRAACRGEHLDVVQYLVLRISKGCKIFMISSCM